MNTPVTYIPNAVPEPLEAFKRLWNELDWVRHDKVPRREYYSSLLGTPYSYGIAAYARVYESQPWHPELTRITRYVEEAAGCKFEVVFLNGYENQSDQLGWHSDNSPEMDDNRPIAIVSLGVEREIWFREIPAIAKSADVEKLKLGHGSICLMNAGMQDTHQHRIPKASFHCGERISITFRGYVEV